MSAAELEALRELNRNYVRAAAEFDQRWYADNLAEDYRATNPDGSFVDRKADGTIGKGRYTDTWARRNGRWLCVSANVSRG